MIRLVVVDEVDSFDKVNRKFEAFIILSIFPFCPPVIPVIVPFAAPVYLAVELEPPHKATSFVLPDVA